MAVFQAVMRCTHMKMASAGHGVLRSSALKSMMRCPHMNKAMAQSLASLSGAATNASAVAADVASSREYVIFLLILKTTRVMRTSSLAV